MSAKIIPNTPQNTPNKNDINYYKQIFCHSKILKLSLFELENDELLKTCEIELQNMTSKFSLNYDQLVQLICQKNIELITEQNVEQIFDSLNFYAFNAIHALIYKYGIYLYENADYICPQFYNLCNDLREKIQDSTCINYFDNPNGRYSYKTCDTLEVACQRGHLCCINYLGGTVNINHVDICCAFGKFRCAAFLILKHGFEYNDIISKSYRTQLDDATNEFTNDDDINDYEYILNTKPRKIKKYSEYVKNAFIFNDSEYPILKKIFDYISKIDHMMISGGYTSLQFHEKNLNDFPNSDIDVYIFKNETSHQERLCIFEKFLNYLKNEFIIEDITSCCFNDPKSDSIDDSHELDPRKKYHYCPIYNIKIKDLPRIIQIIGIDSGSIQEIMDSYDSSYCQTAVYCGVTYVSRSAMICKKTNTNTYYKSYPYDTRVEKSEKYGFKNINYSKTVKKKNILFNNKYTVESAIRCFTISKSWVKIYNGDAIKTTNKIFENINMDSFSIYNIEHNIAKRLNSGNPPRVISLNMFHEMLPIEFTVAPIVTTNNNTIYSRFNNKGNIDNTDHFYINIEHDTKLIENLTHCCNCITAKFERHIYDKLKVLKKKKINTITKKKIIKHFSLNEISEHDCQETPKSAFIKVNCMYDNVECFNEKNDVTKKIVDIDVLRSIFNKHNTVEFNIEFGVLWISIEKNTVTWGITLTLKKIFIKKLQSPTDEQTEESPEDPTKILNKEEFEKIYKGLLEEPIKEPIKETKNIRAKQIECSSDDSSDE